MKKVSLILLLAVICLATNAQYKKASFFNKNGRTFELGTNLHVMGNGRGTAKGFQISQGIDKGKRFFYWSDVEGILPYKFSYQATNTLTQKQVTITGKTAFAFIYRFSAGYYLMNNTEDKKLLPFATLGLGYYFPLDGATVDNNALYTQSADKRPAGDGYIRIGANGGVGLIYNISKSFSLKASGGYNYQGNFGVHGGSNDNVFQPFVSHPIINFNIRYKISSSEE